MAKRYYLSPVIGNGLIDNPYRPLLDDLVKGESGAASSYEIANSDNGTSRPLWALCVIDAQDHVRLRAGQGVDSLPDITLDATLNTLNSGQRTALLARLQALNVDTSGITASSTFVDMLDRIGKHLNGNFNPLRFDAKAR